jgi:hypothetical protein
MFSWNTALTLCLVKLLPVPVIVFFRSRRDLLLENFALAGTLLPLYFNSDQKYQSQSSSGQVVAVMQAAKFGRS